MSSTASHTPDTTPGNVPASTPPSTPHGRQPGSHARLVGLVLGLTVMAGLMLLAFLTPAINSGATDLPLAVSGPAPAVAQVTGALEQHSPGAFEVTTYASADEAAAAIREREAVGGISVSPAGVTIQTASAAGTPYAALLRGLGAGLTAGGQKVTYTDVAPLTADDPAGAGLATLGLPLVFGGMASAALLSIVLGGTRTQRVLGSLAFSLLAGFGLTAILQLWFGSFDGSYLLTASVLSLGIAAISLTVLGLESLLGHVGLGLGALLMLFVANPLSGLATGPQWLPQPWGAVGQLLPVGATGTAVRSAAFFDGHGMTQALVVLACWAVAGLALTLLSARRRARA